MIIVLKPECTNDQLEQFIERLTSHYDLQVNTGVGTQRTVLGLIWIILPRRIWWKA